MYRIFLFLIYLSLPSFYSQAMAETMENSYRLGMEFEVTNDRLAALMDYFQPAHLNLANLSSHLPADFFDTYLEDTPQAFQNLPKYLQNQLSSGLILDNSVLKVNDITPNNQPIERKIILPPAPTPPTTIPKARLIPKPGLHI